MVQNQTYINKEKKFSLFNNLTFFIMMFRLFRFKVFFPIIFNKIKLNHNMNY